MFLGTITVLLSIFVTLFVIFTVYEEMSGQKKIDRRHFWTFYVMSSDALWTTKGNKTPHELHPSRTTLTLHHLPGDYFTHIERLGGSMVKRNMYRFTVVGVDYLNGEPITLPMTLHLDSKLMVYKGFKFPEMTVVKVADFKVGDYFIQPNVVVYDNATWDKIKDVSSPFSEGINSPPTVRCFRIIDIEYLPNQDVIPIETDRNLLTLNGVPVYFL